MPVGCQASNVSPVDPNCLPDVLSALVATQELDSYDCTSSASRCENSALIAFVGETQCQMAVLTVTDRPTACSPRDAWQGDEGDP